MADRKDDKPSKDKNNKEHYDWNILGDRRRGINRRDEAERQSAVPSDRRRGPDRREQSPEDQRIAPQKENGHLGGTGIEEQAVKVELPSQTDYISLVRQFVGGIAKKAGFNDIEIEKIELALDEACSNVLQHAYKFESDNRYAIEITVNNTKLDIIITDQGDSFTFTEAVVPDIEKHVSELKVGGLGIFIMQQMMDDVKYETRANNNILHMVKYIRNKAE
jgi:serine/threonine-protein kinase RsbW